MRTTSMHTSRFGEIRYTPDEVIHFAKGLIGLEHHRHWLLLAESATTRLGWLQAADAP